MNATTSIEVRQLLLTKKEKENRGRTRGGFGVFLSRFFYDFNQLDRQRQYAYMFLEMGERFGSYSIFTMNNGDDCSVDSTNSVWDEKVPRESIFKAACTRWSIILPHQMKNAWNSRAKKLNRRKVPGKYVNLPWEEEREDNTKVKVLNALSYEWDVVVSFLRNCITRQPKALLSSMSYKFGSERVIIGSQTYRNFRFSYLAEISIFGPNFSLLSSNEIISNTKKMVLVHIASQRRMKDLFSKEDLVATEFCVSKNNMEYIQSCCGKVNINYNNRFIIGYILLEDARGRWKILLSDNNIILKPKLKFDNEKKCYIYPSNGKYNIDMYWPIRLLITKNGKGMKVTLNRYAYQKIRSNQYILVNEHSS